MSGEAVGRLFVGAGFVWMVAVLVAGLLGGLDKPSEWVGFLAEVSGWTIIRHAYLALSLLVVPVGMLVYLADVLGDPVALWVKTAAPGALLAVYALFLLTALPDVGARPLLAMESLVPVLASLPRSPDATGSWLLRFAALFALIAGAPGVLGGLVGLMVGGRADGRHPR